MSNSSKNNRILELAAALERGRARFEAIMAAADPAPAEGPAGDALKVGPKGAPARDFPAFAVDEIYALHPGEHFRRLPADGSGTQLSLNVAAPEGMADDSALPVPPDPMTEPKEYNRIAAGDNLDYMVWLLRERNMAGEIRLIYVDPPFFSGAKYLASVQITGRDGMKSPVLKVGAYEDKWGHDLGAYLEMLAVRFYLMRELLADTGSLWVHLDWHGSHYVKMMLDEIFGHENFVNEVAWTYKSGGASKRSFAKKHDTLLFYSKTKEYTFHQLKEKSYNREFKPYHFKGVEEFEDEQGWYTMVNMKDVWSIDMVGRTSSERMGYATQKPEKLLERIIEACTDPGDLCADFFAGTGTLGAVCTRKGRPWILCDEGDAAIGSQILRMADLAAESDPDDASDAKDGKSIDTDMEPAAIRRPFLVERPVLPYEVRPATNVHVKARDGHLMLDRCQPDLTQVQERDREIVTEFIREDSLDLVSFWSVDMKYRGQAHVSRRLLPGDDIVPLPTGARGVRIHIVGYDIFGGRFEWPEVWLEPDEEGQQQEEPKE